MYSAESSQEALNEGDAVKRDKPGNVSLESLQDPVPTGLERHPAKQRACICYNKGVVRSGRNIAYRMFEVEVFGSGKVEVG